MRRLFRILVVGLVAALIAEVGWQAGLLRQLELYVVDAWHQMLGLRLEQEEIPVVLVMVDNRTLDELRDPFAFWGPDFANAIVTIRSAGATVIGLDILFKVGAEDWFRQNGFEDDLRSRTWDAGFREQIFQDDVVLVGHYTKDETGEMTLDLPLWDLWMFLDKPEQNVAVANTIADIDKVVRRFRPAYDPDPQRIGLSLPLLLVLKHLHLDLNATSWELGGRKIVRHSTPSSVAFVGPPGSIPVVSFADVANGELTPGQKELLKGKMVIIGANFAGARDAFATPYLRGPTSLMSGPELHGNVATSVLLGRRLLWPSAGWRWLILLAMAAATTAINSSTRLPTSIASMGLFAVLVG
ncbi:MAG: CHASE2 domain-containing protein, partial [Proteobacteria bacterium]|nr:CHASE2 domain-containing protein [Pseudomonadota bacterium]